MNDNDFMIKQQEAVERMKDFANRSRRLAEDSAPNIPSFVKANIKPQEKQIENEEKTADDLLTFLPFDFGNFPVLSNLTGDKDFGIILALILLLFSEKGDKLLLMALIYILL